MGVTLAETFVAKPPPLQDDGNGVIKVAGTRVPLDSIIIEYWNGSTADEIAIAYDTVGLANIHAVLSYYLENRESVDAYLKEREREADVIRQEIRAKNAPFIADLRKRMLERQRLIAASGQ